jgi:hypothetical protein
MKAWRCEMSKGRVWNKGKRNGGGGPPEGSVSHVVKKANPGTVDNNIVNIDSKIDRVERMNRENWVVRPARVVREKEGNEDNSI